MIALPFAPLTTRNGSREHVLMACLSRFAEDAPAAIEGTSVCQKDDARCKKDLLFVQTDAASLWRPGAQVPNCRHVSTRR
jgi:hypothetical protein